MVFQILGPDIVDQAAALDDLKALVTRLHSGALNNVSEELYQASQHDYIGITDLETTFSSKSPTSASVSAPPTAVVETFSTTSPDSAASDSAFPRLSAYTLRSDASYGSVNVINREEGLPAVDPKTLARSESGSQRSSASPRISAVLATHLLSIPRRVQVDSLGHGCSTIAADDYQQSPYAREASASNEGAESSVPTLWHKILECLGNTVVGMLIGIFVGLIQVRQREGSWYRI